MDFYSPGNKVKMSFAEQPYKKRASLFKQALKFNEIGAGVFLQKVPAAYLKRLYRGHNQILTFDESNDESESEDEDPVIQSLQHLDDIFQGCKSKYVDMASSLEAILANHAEYSRSGGCVILAWEVVYNSDKKEINTPRLVGMATLALFQNSPHFSTDRESLSTEDYNKLRPYAGKYMYVDAMCSTKPGVGRVLLLAAFQYSIQQKSAGLLALAYSSKRGATPESKRLFEQFGFDTIIPRANFKIQRMHGVWYAKPATEVAIDQMISKAFRICTRTGLTESSKLMWRCPGL